MSEWKEYMLCKIQGLTIIDGDRGTNYPKQDDFLNEGHCVFLNTGNVTKEGFNFKDVKFISLEKDNILRKGKLKRYDLVLTTRGTIGNIAFYNDTVIYENLRINSGMILIRFDETVLPSYIYQQIKSSYIQQQFELFASGTAQPQLPIKDLLKVKLYLPPLQTQQKIANILGTYDELIEVNNERINILEETAQSLYKEWFVRFRFPNYQATEFIKGVPKGWEVVKLKNLVSTQYGFTESASSEKIGPKFLRITDIVNNQIDWNSVPYCKVPTKDLDKYLLKCGDIVVARTGATVGFAKRIHKNPPEAVFASYLVRLKPLDDLFSIYLGLSIDSQNYRNYIETVASGSAQPGTNANVMSEFYLFKPNIELLEKLNHTIDPILDQIETLQQQNTELRQIRDRLLPRLISGKVMF